jgi:transposase
MSETVSTAPLLAAGIDAGQRFLDVGFAPIGKGFKVANTVSGITELVARLTRAGVRRVVLEAIGSYAQRLVEALVAAGFEVGIVNPRRIKAFREAEGRRAKTDRLDAALIARFALFMSDAIRPLPSQAEQSLKALSMRRRQLTELMAMEKTRLKQAFEPVLLDSHRATITQLEAERRRIEAEITTRLAALPQREALRRRLTSIPGFGPTIATVLVTELPELGQRDRKAIASLAGLAPHVTQSGNAPPHAAISGGRPCVRTALYMAALVAMRSHPVYKAEYRLMRAAGKPAKVAIIAIARKLLVIANAIAKTGKTFNDH